MSLTRSSLDCHFTPAAERALLEAACWSGGAPPGLPEVLLGLLAEAECRAAGMLAGRGVDQQAVLARWPRDRRPAASRPGGDFSPALGAVFHEVQFRLRELPQPLALATEHLLLGLVAGEHEVAAWLRQHGFDPDSLEAEICRLHGHSRSPLPLDEPDRPEPVGEQSPALGAVSPSPPGEPAASAHPPAAAEAPPSPPPAPLPATTPVLRILDAAANRAREGLRVVEDYARFALDDAHLTGQLKHLRHELAAVLSRFPTAELLASRETRADVGTGLSTAAEQTRLDAAAVVAANFKRLEESLRSLEEFSKLLDPAAAAQLEGLRYRAYTLERAIDVTRRSRLRLATARLYVLIDGQADASALARLVESLVAAGVHLLQLRDKRLPDRQLLERTRIVRQLTRHTPTLFIVNDRPDLAALVGADGVHVGQEELSVKEARLIVGPAALVGVSTHSIEQARHAVLDGADYLGVGPTFPSGTKHFDRFPGLELLRAVSQQIRLPAFAIGGITLENLPQVLSTGIGRIAVSGAVCRAASPGRAAEELLEELARV